MLDVTELSSAAYAKMHITLPESGVQLEVMLVDAQHMSGCFGAYYKAPAEPTSSIVISSAARAARSTFVHELGHALHDAFDSSFETESNEFLEGVATTIERLHDGANCRMSDGKLVTLLRQYHWTYWRYDDVVARMCEMRNGERFGMLLWERIRQDVYYADSIISEAYATLFGEHWCTDSELRSDISPK